jgi:hypothetical protein
MRPDQAPTARTQRWASAAGWLLSLQQQQQLLQQQQHHHQWLQPVTLHLVTLQPVTLHPASQREVVGVGGCAWVRGWGARLGLLAVAAAATGCLAAGWLLVATAGSRISLSLVLQYVYGCLHTYYYM